MALGLFDGISVCVCVCDCVTVCEFVSVCVPNVYPALGQTRRAGTASEFIRDR